MANEGIEPRSKGPIRGHRGLPWGWTIGLSGLRGAYAELWPGVKTALEFLLRGTFACRWAPFLSRAPSAPQHPRSSLDHLVGPDEDRLWEREAEGLGGLHIDDQLEARGLLHGQVGRSAKEREARRRQTGLRASIRPAR